MKKMLIFLPILMALLSTESVDVSARPTPSPYCESIKCEPRYKVTCLEEDYDRDTGIMTCNNQQWGCVPISDWTAGLGCEEIKAGKVYHCPTKRKEDCLRIQSYPIITDNDT